MELIKRRLSVVLAVLFCCFSAVSFTSCSDDEDEEDFISKTATGLDGTKTEFKMTFKNGVSEFLIIKSEYPTEELAIEGEKSVKDVDFDYVSHTRNGKNLEAKYKAPEMTKEQGMMTIELLAQSLEDPAGLLGGLLGEMDGFEFDFE
ncbi:MAG: hypothetical protein J6R41_00300 [Paludibacteraceae bacterium]|nr:hypothetical protein [Paludibacteraceae bacterium]